MAPPSADINVMTSSPPPSSGRQATTATGTAEERLALILSSSSQFSVAAYLNLALEEADGSEELQQCMAQLALQLQLQTQACHEDIGRIGAELQAVLPRCAADVGRVGVGLEGLRMDALSLLESTAVTDAEEDVSSSLETLSTLHALQANLTRTQEILTAAATWDSTLAAVAPLLAQQNLTEAVHALAQLENGERALRGMPNPEEREQAIQRTRQQVSVLLQPQLKHALQNMSTRLAPLQQCVSLYTQLDKMDALKEEYVKIRPAAIHKAWFDYRPSYSSESDDSQAESFIAWLPGWFEAVLSLLAEERRQSMQVFGPELVTEITLKVFAECFRPILASFQSRLESIFSSNLNAPAKGSLQSICTVYESTLQFLSLAYESMTGGWLDMVEANLIAGDGGATLYTQMTAAFLQIATPFVAYQTTLAELEIKNSEKPTQLMAKDIRQAVGGVSSQGSMLDSLQHASEQLQSLSSRIFPMAEGAVARFELLNGGYAATNALSSVDKLLSGQAGELAIAIHTLSTAMTADEKQLAENFDEQHVLCALEVLKIAGLFRRDMRSFESKSRGRLGVLGQRMAAHAAQERKVKEASPESPLKTPSKGFFVVPDSMSIVEIDSFLSKAVCGDSDNDSGAASFTALQRLAADDHGTTPLYPQAAQATTRLANSCHSFVFDVCSSVPRYHLSGMSSMSAWKEDAVEDNLASYGTLPQSYITHVGEHMLALVQALEPFASDHDALTLANEVMDGLRDVAVRPWRDFLDASGSSSDPDKVVAALMDGKEIASMVLGYAEMEDEEELEEEDEATKRSSAFCNAWLDVVGLAVAGRLLERIMRIPNLTPKGCEHLNADLNYLVNVFSALGVSGHPHPLLGHIAEISVLSGEDLAQEMSQRDKSNPLQQSLLSIEERVAAMRRT